MAELYSLSGRNPWMYLIVKGFKKIENRHCGLSAARLNAPIAVHVSQREYEQSERHAYYALPVVQRCLARDEQTRHMHADFPQLDAFFAAMRGSVIGVVFFSESVVAIEGDASANHL